MHALAGLFAAFTATIAPVGGGNALTLPSARHLALFGPTQLLAVQQDGMDGRGLGWFRSDDAGQSWAYYAPIQDDYTERDTADLLVVGNDIALIYSYETPDNKIDGSTTHDVWFQWWRYQSTTRDWRPDAAVRVFDSTSSGTAYYRAAIARDSAGRIWIQAFEKLSTGAHSAVIAVSGDGGASFQIETPLATKIGGRGGGRLISLGSSLLFIWSTYTPGAPTWYKTRRDTDDLATWTATAEAFADGIYHGASLSAVADGAGGLHLVYKDQSYSYLWYRYFDGSSFSDATLLEDQGDWELQPAVTRLGADLVLFYNRVISSGYVDELRYRTWHAGSWSDPTVLDGSSSFKGYPAAPETLPASTTQVECAWGITPTANDPGNAVMYGLPWNGTAPGPDMTIATVDMAAPHADLSVTTAADLSVTKPADMTVTTTPPDLSSSTAGTTLFADDFNRNNPDDLGASWTIPAGYWLADGQCESNLDGQDLAIEDVVSCANCQVAAAVIGFGVPETDLVLRAPTPSATGDRYEVALLGDGSLVVRRVSGGVVTALGKAASGIADLGSPATIALSATGTSPVTLVASVDGTVVIRTSDASPPTSLRGAGYAGMHTLNAGVVYRNFRLISE